MSDIDRIPLGYIQDNVIFVRIACSIEKLRLLQSFSSEYWENCAFFAIKQNETQNKFRVHVREIQIFYDFKEAFMNLMKYYGDEVYFQYFMELMKYLMKPA